MHLLHGNPYSLTLISIDGHLHSPLICLVHVRPSSFFLSSPQPPFYSTYSAMSMAHAHVLREDWKTLRKPIIGIYKPSSIMKIPTSIWKWQHRRLYHEDHGATLKHKCGKRIVALPLLSFSLIFYLGLLFFMASFLLFFYLGFFGLFYLFIFCPESHPDLWGNHSLHHPFLTGTML